MAVCTPDNAFCHLLFDLLSSASGNKSANFRNLFPGNVVEFKHNNIILTAVHARVFIKISPDELSIVIALPATTNIATTIVCFSIALIVRFAVSALTLAAIRHGKKLPDLPR
jgi:hypothetical protein